uniref:Uncharacterized protein n=1 Tax=Roseihalotalea indica TaxID=2867963 RepID=A0AA49GI78_9BACT|nr:hypothetical protein K4G66_18540 [Tunicatimonas sp. TK19036]
MHQEWNAEHILQDWITRHMRSLQIDAHSSKPLPIQFYNKDDYISIAELEVAVVKAARIVQQLGSNYIDIFERAEHELAKAKQHISSMERINKIATTDTIIGIDKYYKNIPLEQVKKT